MTDMFISTKSHRTLIHPYIHPTSDKTKVCRIPIDSLVPYRDPSFSSKSEWIDHTQTCIRLQSQRKKKVDKRSAELTGFLEPNVNYTYKSADRRKEPDARNLNQDEGGQEEFFFASKGNATCQKRKGKNRKYKSPFFRFRPLPFPKIKTSLAFICNNKKSASFGRALPSSIRTSCRPSRAPISYM